VLISDHRQKKVLSLSALSDCQQLKEMIQRRREYRPDPRLLPEQVKA
jgi:hypothetical protein